MKGKLLIILISIIFAYLLVSAGYGMWEKKLVIKGNIEIVEKNYSELSRTSDIHMEDTKNVKVTEEVYGRSY